MTREEYNAKTANGTLTVGDVIRNPEFATSEQVERIVNPELLRELRKRTDSNAEVLRRFATMINEEINHVGEDLGVMYWEQLTDTVKG